MPDVFVGKFFGGGECERLVVRRRFRRWPCERETWFMALTGSTAVGRASFKV